MSNLHCGDLVEELNTCAVSFWRYSASFISWRKLNVYWWENYKSVFDFAVDSTQRLM